MTADETTDTPATGDPDTKQEPPAKANNLPEVERALRKANKEAETLRLKLKEIEDADKSESQKLADQLAEANRRAEAAEATALRFEVASTKGLNASQAKRLVGVSREELEADADELLSTFRPADDPTPRKPAESLTGGTDPSSNEPKRDIRKIVAEIPRGF